MKKAPPLAFTFFSTLALAFFFVRLPPALALPPTAIAVVDSSIALPSSTTSPIPWAGPIPPSNPLPDPPKADLLPGDCATATAIRLDIGARSPCRGRLLPSSEVQYLLDVRDQRAAWIVLLQSMTEGRIRDRAFADAWAAHVVGEARRTQAALENAKIETMNLHDALEDAKRSRLRTAFEGFLVGGGVGAGIVAGVVIAAVASR